MEDLDALIVTCRHLRHEGRDETLARARRQKHAAHCKATRLREKVRQLEVANRILAACWATTAHHNEILSQQITRIAKEAREDLP